MRRVRVHEGFTHFIKQEIVACIIHKKENGYVCEKKKKKRLSLTEVKVEFRVVQHVIRLFEV